MRTVLCLTASALLAGAAACAQSAAVEQGRPNVPEFNPAFPEQTRAPEQRSDLTLAVETIASGLEHAWGMALLPDGGYLVTERPGRLRVVAPDGTLSDPVQGLPEVLARGQGGLLDVAVSPTFAEDRIIYWTYAKPVARGSSTAAARGRLAEDGASVTDVQDVFVQDPPSPTTNHYGSRVIPDGAGHLFITTGEHQTQRERQYAQHLDKTYGKIVRINLDGTPPADNPFAGLAEAVPTIWSLGHRNIQGAALDADGQLWAVEHGPKGGDELNRIEPAANYGWPVISYGENYNGSPVGESLTARRGDGAAALLLGPGDRPRRHGLLRRRHVPGLAGRRPDRRDEPGRAGAARPRRRHRRPARSGSSPTPAGSATSRSPRMARSWS